MREMSIEQIKLLGYETVSGVTALSDTIMALGNANNQMAVKLEEAEKANKNLTEANKSFENQVSDLIKTVDKLNEELLGFKKPKDGAASKKKQGSKKDE